jgi:hypothetical protein
MKIFYDYQEIKECVGFANVNNDLQSLEPYVESAVNDIILTIVGGSLLEELAAKAEDVSFDTGFESEAWDGIKKVAANYAYLLWASDGTVSIDNFGIRQIDDGQSKSAYQWQVREFKEARLLRSYQHLHKLAMLLWTERPALWLADTVRLPIEKMLLWKMSDWREARSLYSWYSFLSIVGQVNYVLDRKILPLIGESRYTDLLAEVAAPGAETAGNKKLLKCIRQALAHFSIVEAAKEINFKLTSNGLQVVEIDATSSNDKAIRSLNAQEKENLIAHAIQRGNEAMCCIENIVNPPTAPVVSEEETAPQKKVLFLG